MSTLNRLLRKSDRLVVGLNSGTSADGVDACLVRFTGGRGISGIRLLSFRSFPFSPGVRRAILKICDPDFQKLDEMIRVNYALGEYFAEAAIRVVEESGHSLSQLDLVGSHGQTIRHLPRKKRSLSHSVRATLQIGELAVIANRTGVVTVGDFRASDVAAGGEGAPLTPYCHHFLFADKKRNVAVVNIGGIANVTFLPAGCSPKQISAYDTGPGNMVVDYLAGNLFGKSFDCDGKIALSGTVSPKLLSHLLRDPYYRRRPPKSTGREKYDRTFCERLIERAKSFNLSKTDLIATGSELTVKTIASAVKAHSRTERIVLCGGGALNLYFRKRLSEELEPRELVTSEEFGIPLKGTEPLCFAILANETINGKRTGLPNVTGAKNETILGKICLP
jgi:anhydro-N-acetylmuramic acid kinase